MNLSDTHVQITCGWRTASVASVADGMGGESCLLPAPSLVRRSRHLAWRYKLPFKLLRRSDGRWRWPVGDRAAVVLGFLAFKKYLGRIEMRTRNKKYLGRIRSVWDISRRDWARIPNCIVRTSPDRQTDRLKTNYSIDTVFAHRISNTFIRH